MPTAVLIDGGYFIKRFRSLEPQNIYNADRAADLVHRWALAHLKQGVEKKSLYRIFFYDCPPLEKKMHNPISKRAVDFSKSGEALFRKELHKKLRLKRKVALRLGQLAGGATWVAKDGLFLEILKGERTIESLTDNDVIPAVRQKGVDMKIGLDISTMALKGQVDQIVLFAGDADFVPAAKLARREGIDFILDPMWRKIPEELEEHIDGMRSVCPSPQRRKKVAISDVVVD